MNTPEFLVWAVEYRCSIRGSLDGSDPERSERQLRAARAVSDARRAGRVFEGLCVDPPYGFRIEEALAVYGGLSGVELACGDCPANAKTWTSPDALAVCFGILPLWPGKRDIHAVVEELIDSRSLAPEYERLFRPTQPRWHGLWLQSPLQSEQLSCVMRLLDGEQDFDELQAGVRAAIDAKLPLHAALYPRGRVEGTWWRLDRHCPRCKAAWGAAGSRECHVCGRLGNAAPEEKRRTRGRRPYFPLARLIGEQAAADFLVRYEAHRAQRQLTDWEQSPHREVPPDSPPAG